MQAQVNQEIYSEQDLLAIDSAPQETFVPAVALPPPGVGGGRGGAGGGAGSSGPGIVFNSDGSHSFRWGGRSVIALSSDMCVVQLLGGGRDAARAGGPGGRCGGPGDDRQLAVPRNRRKYLPYRQATETSLDRSGERKDV